MPTPLPSKSEAIQVEAALRTFLMPADAPFVRQRLAMLKLVTASPGTDGMSEQDIAAMIGAQIGEYLRLLAAYPADIWAWACDEAPKRSKWFPMVADLEALMKPKLEQRQRAHGRARQILDAISNPRARVAHQPRSAAERQAERRQVMINNGLDPDRPIAQQLFRDFRAPATRSPIDEERTPAARPSFIWVMPDGRRVTATERPAGAMTLRELQQSEEAAG